MKQGVVDTNLTKVHFFNQLSVSFQRRAPAQQLRNTPLANGAALKAGVPRTVVSVAVPATNPRSALGAGRKVVIPLLRRDSTLQPVQSPASKLPLVTPACAGMATKVAAKVIRPEPSQ